MRLSRSAVGIAAAVIAVAFGAINRGEAQTAAPLYHNLEVRLQARTGNVGYLRVILLNQSGRQPVAEKISRPEGKVLFNRIKEGDYIVQTFESDVFEATETDVKVFAADPQHPRSENVVVFVDLPRRQAVKAAKPGVINADVDLNVPKDARKRYSAGIHAIKEGDSFRAIKELQAAIEKYPEYYMARLELGRILRSEKRLSEAEEVLRSLPVLAPKRSDARVEYGLVLLDLGQRANAAGEFRDALVISETDWTANYYLGWALLEDKPTDAIQYFKRALELSESNAVRAHLALARIAEQNGQRELAVKHLDTYVALAPKNPDADAARELAARLRR